MITKPKKLFVVVCYANYCRSPVAEVLLKSKFKSNDYNFISAGINPIAKASMDPRSQEYLLSIGEKESLHTPQRIRTELILNAERVFALDPLILMMLNKKYPRQQRKFKLLNFQNPKILLIDPYKSNKEKYTEIMENIRLVVSNLDL